MKNPKLTIHKSTLLNLYNELQHIKSLIDDYPSDLQDPQIVYDEKLLYKNGGKKYHLYFGRKIL